jgi:hypothetical protein
MLPIIFAAAPALAQPAPAPAPAPVPAPAAAPVPAAGGACNVNIVRAPDPVRQTIERWLANEHCTLALQVRIIPTEGGLYLLATDEHGRVRERIVPDAQSAGVLIASWAADDGLGGAAPPPGVADSGPPLAPPVAPPNVAPPVPMGPPPMQPVGPSAYGGPPPSFNSMSFRAPGQYNPNNPNDELPPPAEPRHPSKLLQVSAGFGANNSGGLRVELELWNHSDWIIGASAGITGSDLQVDNGYGYNQSTYYSATASDMILAATFGHIARWGDWHLRGLVGVGLMVTSLTLESYDYNTYSDTSGNGSETSPYIEAALYLGHSIGSSKQWEIEAGPVLSYSKQDWYLQDSGMDLFRDAGNAMFMLGLRHGL